MATRMIPEKRIFICDCCLRENQPRRMEGKLIFTGHALDYNGDPAACGDWSKELCDECYRMIATAINKSCEAIRIKLA